MEYGEKETILIKILIMNGAAESGKGTVVKNLYEFFAFDIMEYSSIDYVKKVAKEQFEWDGEKDTKGRNLLSTIKQTMIAYNDLPLRKISTVIREANIYGRDILVVDIREPDEIEKLVNYCKDRNVMCHTCRVHNSKAESKVKKSDLSFTGDRLYGRYDYDINIHNNGTKDELAIRVVRTFNVIYNESNGHLLDSVKYLLEERKNGIKED